MTDSRDVPVEEICLRALDLGPAERVAFVAHACRGDDLLRREIESLLAQRETAERFTLAPPTALTLRLDAKRWQTFDVTGRRVVPDPGSPLAAGTIINGRYVIHGTLGIGGMGHVYRAVDSVADRTVALKRLVSDDVSPSVVDWLEAEFQTMAQFVHPNVAAVYDFAQGEGDAFGHFFTMELVDGRNALSATDGTGISAIVNIAVEICRALAYLHSRDVVHHDLKPANVLVAADGHVKIVDFGISSVGRRASGTVRGTPFYMAPECFSDGVVDRRADFYSLGVMLYQLVYRRLPFVADDLAELLRLHASADLSFPTGADPANPLRPVIRRLIAKNPADRFTSGNDVIAAINAHTGRSFELETAATRHSYVLSPRFVGRRREFDALCEFVRRRFDGETSAPPGCLVGGPSGIGKSRLLRELRHHLQLNGRLFVEGNCYEHVSSPFSALSEAVGALAAALRARGATDVLGRYRHELAILAPAAVDHLDAGVARVPDAPQHEFSTRLVDFFSDASETVPFAIYLNDLQWASRETIHLLSRLLEHGTRASRNRVPQYAVIGTFRNDETAGRPLESLVGPDTVDGRILRLTLDPFTSGEVKAFIESMLGVPRVPELFVERIIAETQGNAFFLQEIVRTLMETGAVRLERGGWSTSKTLDTFEIPASISDLFSRRLANLTPTEQDVLVAMAVFARPVPLSVLEVIVPRSTATDLDALERRQLVLRVASAKDTYTFSHDRIREAVYGQIELSDRRRLHGVIAGHFSESSAEDDGQAVFDLAHHVWFAERYDAALPHLMKAGEQAYAAYALDMAITSFERALWIADRGVHSDRRAIVERLVDVQILAGRYERAEALCRELQTMATDASGQAAAHRRLAALHFQRGQLQDAVRELWAAASQFGVVAPSGRTALALQTAASILGHVRQRLLGAKRRMPDAGRTELGRVYVSLTYVYFFLDPQRVPLVITRATNLLEGDGDSAPLCEAYGAIGVIYGTLGRLDDALMFGNRAVEIADRLGSDWLRAHARLHRGITLFALMEWDACYEDNRFAMKQFRVHGDYFYLAATYYHCGKILHARGRLAEALDCVDEGIEFMERTGSLAMGRSIMGLSGLFAVKLGRVDEGLAKLRHSLELARHGHDTLVVAELLIFLGEALLTARQDRAACAALEESRQLREQAQLRLEHQAAVYHVLARALVACIADGSAAPDAVSECRMIVDRALRLSRRRYANHRAPALLAAGLFEWQCGDRGRARSYFSESIAVAEARGLDQFLREACLEAGVRLSDGSVEERRQGTEYLARAERFRQGCLTPSTQRERGA